MKKLSMKIIKYLKKNKYIDLVFLFYLTFFVYVHNLSPSVYGGDSGDLLSAAITKGVPHPSGYPLFTILGILFLKFPINATPAWKVGLVSALFSSLTVITAYLLVYQLVKNRYYSIICSLTLAFIYPFWLYSEIVEVFTLHSFFILFLLLLRLRCLHLLLEKRHTYRGAF